MWECKCGHKNENSAKYCNYCGEKRAKPSSAKLGAYKAIYSFGLVLTIVSITTISGLTVAHEYVKSNTPADYLPTSIAQHSAPPTPQSTPTPAATPTPTPTPKPTAKPTPKPTSKPTPSPASAEVQLPQSGNYYSSEKTGYINAPGGYAVYGFAYPKRMSENIIIMEPLHGASITAYAEENGFAYIQIKSTQKWCWVNADYISSTPPVSAEKNSGFDAQQSSSINSSTSSSYSDYTGSWFKDGNSENYFINVHSQNETSISFSIEAVRTGANGSPAQYATAEVSNLDVSSGQADFYFTDSFENTGSGTVYLNAGEIRLSLNTTYTPSGNNWGIQPAAGSYYRYS